MNAMFWTFVDAGQLRDGRAVIDGPAGHHLARVLRVRAGERGVLVADGVEHEVEVTEVLPGRVAARVLRARGVAGEPAIAIVLLQALLPNADFDAVIEAATEVGVRRFVPVRATRSVARPANDRVLRWRSIARSAAEQSHRGRIPEVVEPAALELALGQAQGRLLVLDPEAKVPLASELGDGQGYTIAVGPEGGWTEAELGMMRQAGGRGVHLGPRILRARLAPVVAAAILVQQS